MLGSSVFGALKNFASDGLTSPIVTITDPNSGQQTTTIAKNKKDALRKVVDANQKTVGPAQAVSDPNARIPEPAPVEQTTMQPIAGGPSVNVGPTPQPSIEPAAAQIAGPPGSEASPSPDKTQYEPGASAAVPKFLRQSYAEATAPDAKGMPSPHGLTKLGKLLFLSTQLAEGGMEGAGQHGFAPGFQAERQAEVQQAVERQKLEAGGIQNQMGRAQIENLPWQMQNQRQQAQASLEKTRAETAYRQFQAKAKAKDGPTLKQAFDTRVQLLTKQGKDWSEDPEAVAYNDAILSTQKPASPVHATVNTKQGVMQFNQKTGKYDTRVGDLPPTGGAASASDDDVKFIADGIESGDQPPTTSGLYRYGAKVRAELARRGFPLAKAQQDWQATQRYLQTLNGPQQTRLRQNMAVIPETLDKLEGLYDEWAKLAPVNGYPKLNRAALAAMKQIPGRAGDVARALETQIADLTAELGTIYMGGNTPTDHGLELASKNLGADWNEGQFKEGLKQARENLRIRQNSILHTLPGGVDPNSPYIPKQGAGGGSTQPQGGSGSEKKTYGVPI